MNYHYCAGCGHWMPCYFVEGRYRCRGCVAKFDAIERGFKR